MPFDAGYQQESVADLIDRAAAMITSREDWCQGRMVDQMGRHCAVGALTAVTFGDGDRGTLYLAFVLSRDEFQVVLSGKVRPQAQILQRAINYLNAAAMERGYSNIMSMNDYPRCFRRLQHRQLLRAMREAAVRARDDQLVTA